MIIKAISTLLIAIFLLFQNPLVAAERGLHRSDVDQANSRFALIIGNGNYDQLPKLRNPRNDAEDISRSLSNLGFDTELLLDANQETMEGKIVDFGKKLNSGGVGLFYYAGHGIQSKGRNYLIPSNAKLKSEKDLRYKTVDIGQVLSEMENANNGFNIIILDACRNNPLASQFRSTTRGLTRLNAPRGTLVAFATGPGMAAEDGTGRNGTFTKHFLAALKISNVTIEQTFKTVLKNVDQETKGQQTPWVSSSFTGDFYFNVNASLLSQPSAAPKNNQANSIAVYQAPVPAPAPVTPKPKETPVVIEPRSQQKGFDGRWEGHLDCGESPRGHSSWRRFINVTLQNNTITDYTVDFSHIPRKKLNKLHHAFPEDYFVTDTLMRSPARGEISDGEFEIKYDFIFNNDVFDVYLNGNFDGEKFVLTGQYANRDCEMTLFRKE